MGGSVLKVVMGLAVERALGEENGFKLTLIFPSPTLPSSSLPPLNSKLIFV